MFLVCTSQYKANLIQERTTTEPVTGLLIHIGSKGCPTVAQIAEKCKAHYWKSLGCCYLTHRILVLSGFVAHWRGKDIAWLHVHWIANVEK